MDSQSPTSDSLCEQCRQENKEPHSSYAACLSLLCHAFSLKCSSAMECVYEIYVNLFYSWVVNHGQWDILVKCMPDIEASDIVQDVLANVLHRIPKGQDCDNGFSFSSMGAFMNYIKISIKNKITELVTRKCSPRADNTKAIAVFDPIKIDMEKIDIRAREILSKDEYNALNYYLYKNPTREHLLQEMSPKQLQSLIAKTLRKLRHDLLIRKLLDI